MACVLSLLDNARPIRLPTIQVCHAKADPLATWRQKYKHPSRPTQRSHIPLCPFPLLPSLVLHLAQEPQAKWILLVPISMTRSLAPPLDSCSRFFGRDSHLKQPGPEGWSALPTMVNVIFVDFEGPALYIDENRILQYYFQDWLPVCLQKCLLRQAQPDPNSRDLSLGHNLSLDLCS